MTRTVLVASAALLLTLGGCSSLRTALGLEKQPPDEFTVVEHAPLIMPPDFGLRPPVGSGGGDAAEPVEQARETVFGLTNNNAEYAANGRSPGESALLAHAGGASTDANIRAEIDQETAAIDQPHDDFIDHLLFWKSSAAPDESLDASAEAQRLRDAGALDKPAASGPTIEHKDRSVLQDPGAPAP